MPRITLMLKSYKLLEKFADGGRFGKHLEDDRQPIFSEDKVSIWVEEDIYEFLKNEPDATVAAILEHLTS